MSVSNVLAEDEDFESDRDRVDVADIDVGMELSFTDKNDKGEPGKPNACNPDKFTIAVDVEEGYRSAWDGRKRHHAEPLVGLDERSRVRRQAPPIS